jgi:hypothetical protein
MTGIRPATSDGAASPKLGAAATFGAPDLTTFCNLDSLDLVVLGQRVDVGRAVLECHVVDAYDSRRAGGGRGRPLGNVTHTLAQRAEPVASAAGARIAA